MSIRRITALLGCLALAPLAMAGDTEGRGPPQGAQERWTARDADGDGAISLAEAEAGMPGLAQNFARLDTDGDGKVTREEMHAARTATREERRERAEERYRTADTNGDGVISREEAQAGMPRAAEHFAEVDADGNGQLTREEMRAAMKARRGARMPSGPGAGMHNSGARGGIGGGQHRQQQPGR